MIDLRWIRVGVLSYPDSDRPWDDDDDDDVLGWAGLSRVELGWPHAETYVYIMTSKAGRQAGSKHISFSLPLSSIPSKLQLCIYLLLTTPSGKTRFFFFFFFLSKASP